MAKRVVRDDTSPRNGESDVDCSGDPGRTKQEFSEECDINNLLRRYHVTGQAPVMREPGAVGDFSDVGDYFAAQRLIVRAREQFDALGSEVRDFFRNDPARFLEFMNDPKNADEAVRLGLATARPAPPAPPPPDGGKPA